MNIVTPVFYERNFFDEKGILHPEKQLIQKRFIYLINRFTKDSPDIVSEYYVNKQGKLCRWDNLNNSWKIIPIAKGKYFFYVTEKNIPLSKDERQGIKKDWVCEKEITSDFNQQIILEDKKVLITLYEKNYFDKASEKVTTNQIIKNKYAYIVNNFFKGFQKNIKQYFINSEGHLCDDKKNPCLFYPQTYYIYVTFDEKEICKDNIHNFTDVLFQELKLKQDRYQTLLIVWQAEFIRDKILKSKLKICAREIWSEQKIKFKGMEYHFDYSIIAIHHSGDNVLNDWFGNTKTPIEIESEHINKNQWDDIGYHFLINPEGKIFEGRALYFKGSHIYKANSHKIGIVLIGDFEPPHSFIDRKTDNPTEKQIASLKNLIELLKQYFFMVLD